jgi:hypothetical protein
MGNELRRRRRRRLTACSFSGGAGMWSCVAGIHLLFSSSRGALARVAYRLPGQTPFLPSFSAFLLCLPCKLWSPLRGRLPGPSPLVSISVGLTLGTQAEDSTTWSHFLSLC